MSPTQPSAATALTSSPTLRHFSAAARARETPRSTRPLLPTATPRLHIAVAMPSGSSERGHLPERGLEIRDPRVALIQLDSTVAAVARRHRRTDARASERPGIARRPGGLDGTHVPVDRALMHVRQGGVPVADVLDRRWPSRRAPRSTRARPPIRPDRRPRPPARTQTERARRARRRRDRTPRLRSASATSFHKNSSARKRVTPSRYARSARCQSCACVAAVPHVDQGSRGLARPSEARPQHPRALGEIRHRATSRAPRTRRASRR